MIYTIGGSKTMKNVIDQINILRSNTLTEKDLLTLLDQYTLRVEDWLDAVTEDQIPQSVQQEISKLFTDAMNDYVKVSYEYCIHTKLMVIQETDHLVQVVLDLNCSEAPPTIWLPKTEVSICRGLVTHVRRELLFNVLDQAIQSCWLFADEGEWS